MPLLGNPAGLRVESQATLGQKMIGVDQPEIRGPAPVPWHIERQVDVLIAEIRGLRTDLASRTLVARTRWLWVTVTTAIRTQWRAVRARVIHYVRPD